MRDLLKDKIEIITCERHGIGKAIAERIAPEKCNPMLASRTKSELEKTAESIQK